MRIRAIPATKQQQRSLLMLAQRYQLPYSTVRRKARCYSIGNVAYSYFGVELKGLFFGIERDGYFHT